MNSSSDYVRRLGGLLFGVLLLCGCSSEKPVPAPSTASEAAQNPAKQGETLTFGIVPQQSASKLAKLWMPIMKLVGEDAGVKLVFQTAKDIPEFEKRCKDGSYKIAYMNPFHYTQFHEDPGFIAVAKQKGKKIQGILVVHKDNESMDLNDLAGKTLAFPAPDAFAATLLPTRELKARKVPIEFQSEYVSSHDSVYRSVAQGLYVAGGGIIRTFNNVDPQVSSQLIPIYRTRKYTPHAFAIHPSVDAKTRQRIAEALIGLGQSEEGRNLLSTIKFDGIEAAEDQEWDIVRGLNLPPIDFND